MSKKTKENKTKNNRNKKLIIGAIIAVIIVAVIGIVVAQPNNKENSEKQNSKGMAILQANEDNNIIMDVSDVTEKAKFYAYNVDGIDIEIFAVKASDGTIRTAFNTCQVCSPSPKAYFVQEGKDFICQNCMNAFPTDRIGLERGGCNPIPISFEERKDEDGKIILAKEFVESYKDNFDK